ncbi:hypothetical protein FCV58_15035 [Vibrio sp. F13]|uniref:oligosaccharide flippase family protein n=1 Tax=Vibrio sp. F13 TaxID=2070777 RepID=UPI0010BD973B|nr:oligosaccharide flippase family protein [Vibrio sp. F13]TKF64188.1 hypothetical protein FCV58_15035 [Vibrio sp. F13]
MIKILGQNMLGQIVNLLVTIIYFAILGRVVPVTDFGQFAVLMSVYGLIVPLLDSGLTQAYIKSNDNSNNIKSVFFFVNFGIATLVAALYYIIMLSLYNSVDNTLLILMMLTIIMQSVCLQPLAILSKMNNFKTIQIINVSSNILSATLVVLLSEYNSTSIILVIKSLIEYTIKAVLVWRITRYRLDLIRWSDVKNYIDDILFGVSIVKNRIVFGFQNSVDKIIISKLASLDYAAFYSQSNRFSSLPETTLRPALTSPIFSRIAEDQNKGIDSKTKYEAYSSLVVVVCSIPCSVIIYGGHYLLPLLLGSNWSNSGYIFNMMGVLGYSKVLSGSIIFVWTNERQVNALTKINLLYSFFTLLISIAVLCMYSYEYFLPALASSSIVLSMVLVIYTLKHFTGRFPLFMFSYLLTNFIVLIFAFSCTYQVVEITILGFISQVFLFTLLPGVFILKATKLINS